MNQDAEFRRRVQDLFLLVADLPPEERKAVLDRECHADTALREEVDSLLAHDGAGTFIAGLVERETIAVASAAESQWIGRRLGAWRITGVLGRGGMGAVYEAERDDGAFRQRAALKLVRAHLDTDQGRARFLEERQILAHLNHPNIARLLDGGESEDGVPFLVMEAVDGLPLTTYCETNRLPLAARLGLFIAVCHAVHFAHTQLVVHRDLKPANILVDADGQVKLLDFGIAKLLTPGASTLLTLDGELALTPDYASPEQVRGEPVATSTDIYSLGAVLFELLTGTRAHAFGSNTLPELIRVICERPVGLPSDAAPPAVARALRGDLDNIVLTALRKEPARRYASVDQLADDLERHLTGHPVAARGDAWSYRSAKFVRRNRIAVAAAAIVVLSLVGGIIGTLWQARRAEHRFQQVRGLANTFLFDFHDAIRDLPGSTHARELVVQTALKYLDTLADDARDDARLQMELAAAYEKVGDVQGNPRNPNLGRTDDALKSYARSLELRTTASGTGIDTADEAHAVLQSHLKLADILISTGKSDDASMHVDAAATLTSQSARANDRIDVLMRQGELSLRRGDLAATETTYRNATDLAQREARLHPGPQSSTTVAAAASRIAYVYKMASRQKECLAALDIALAASRDLATAEPARTSHVRQILSIHNDRGDALRSPFASEGMQPRLSLVEYEESQRLAAQLAEADPSDFSARLALLLSKAQVADTWREIEPARALPLFEQLFGDLDAAMRTDPASFQAAWMTALSHLAYANATAGSGDTRNALARFDDAVIRIAKMRETDRGRSISRRDSAKAHTDRGRTRLHAGDVAGADADAASCREYASSFIKADSRPVDLRDVALCYAFSAEVAGRQGRAQDVTRWAAEAGSWWQEFDRRKFDSAFLREQKAIVAALQEGSAIR